MGQVAKKPAHAERHFSLACAEEGATCNKATEDDQGWDWFVEFPRASVGALPADMREGPLKVLVQIKSSSGTARTKLKLTNALRFSKDEIPCFIVLYQYAEGSSPTIFLYHCWQDFITAALERVRRCEMLDHGELHRATMPIVFGAEHVVAGNIAEAIRREVEKIGELYGNLKKDFSQKIGFGSDALVGKFSFSEGITEEDISDMQLGLKEDLAVSHFEARTKRFGILAKDPHIEAQDARVSIKSNGVPCDVIFSTSGPRRQVKFPGRFYTAGPPLQQENWKLRAVWAHGEVVWKPSARESDFTFQWDGGATLPLAELSKVLRLGAMLQSGTIRLELRGDAQPIYLGEAEIDCPPVGKWWKVLDEFISGFSSSLEGKPPLAFADFHDKIPEILKYLQFMSPGEITLNVEVHDARAAAKVSEGTLLYGVGVEVSGMLFWTFVKRKLKTTKLRGGNMELKFESIEYRQSDIYEGSLAENGDQLSEELEALTKSASTEGVLVAQVPNVLLLPQP